MSTAELSNEKFQAKLQELARFGSPVDLSVADVPRHREKMEIEQVGGIYNSQCFELEDGRFGCMVDVVVTNQTARMIHLVDVQLRSRFVDDRWSWLQPRRFNSIGRNAERGDRGYLAYRFPGKCGLELPYETVINHSLFEARRLPSKLPVEGWLLGIGGQMPAELEHGRFLRMTVVIVAADHSEYKEPVLLWTARLEPLPKIRTKTGPSEPATRRHETYKFLRGTPSPQLRTNDRVRKEASQEEVHY